MNKIILKLSIIGALLLSSFPFVLTYAQNNNEKIIKEYTPKLQIESVIQKAKKYAMTQGQKIEEYFIQQVKYDADKKEWSVFFMGNLPVPGNFFDVIIEDRTEKMRLMLGE